MIQIIDYGAGNICSITNALKKLGEKFETIGSPRKLRDSAKIIFPGVGAAGSAMKNLKKNGFSKIIPHLKQPFLGICLGMQILFKYSEENETKCLNIFDGKVKKFSNYVKSPQIGWNKVFFKKPDPLFENISDKSYFYFVNSYFADNEEYSIGKSFYGNEFCSVVKKNNFYGVQFHPEKSGETGLLLLNNFCKLC